MKYLILCARHCTLNNADDILKLGDGDCDHSFVKNNIKTKPSSMCNMADFDA